MHVSFISRLSLLVGASVALPSLFACLDHPLKPVEYDQSQEKQDAIALTVNKDVDILFVIDNSGSMGEEQATLARNFERFINVLEEPGVEANYRIGVTTTDNGNPYCGTTGPEAGRLRLTSCRSRESEFTFNDSVEKFEEACNAVCPDSFTAEDGTVIDLNSIPIEPTEIDGGGEPVARNWLENIEGRTNLPAGLTTVQAFQCFGPQGIDGCGFESHLESMWKALSRAGNNEETDFGFIRDNAILSIVHVTDEADCSYNTDWETIFQPEGNRVFWSDPEAGQPSSAVCWNAGVACSDGPGTYSGCRSVNFDEDGVEIDETNGGDPSEDAVLRPVSRYTEFVQNFEDNKQVITPDQEVLVAVIGGVSEDYMGGEITYQDSPGDTQFQSDFGIGPGCQKGADGAEGQAVPPVRLKEFADAFKVGDANNLFSICADDYGPALEAIADAIADQVKPACMPACVADAELDTPNVLNPSCTLIQEAPQADGNFEETPIQECNDQGEEIPEGQNVCYRALVGDELDPFCSDQGLNLEFQLVRRDGFPAPGGTSVKATCQLSQSKAVDCPNLP